MAAKPTLSNAEWATDATFSAGPDSGQNTKVSASAGVKAQGWRPGDALGFVGAWFNYWMNQIYSWMAYLSDGAFTGNTSFSGGTFSVAGEIQADGGVLVNNGNPLTLTGEANYDAPRARTVLVPILFAAHSSESPTPHWSQTLSGTQPNLVTFVNSDEIKIPFSVPSDSEITSVRAGVQQSATSATDMTFRVYKAVADKSGASMTPTVTQIGVTDTAADDGPDILTTGAVTETVDLATTSYYAIVTASANAADATGDALFWLEVNYTSPGLRDY